MDLFSFLDECEARAKLGEHGPYKISKNETLIFREILHLYDGRKPHFPWSATEAKAPYTNIAFAYRLKNVEAKFDDFSTMTTTPGDFTEKITGIALLRRDRKKIKPVDMDELEAFNDYAVKAQEELYLRFSEWDKRQRLIAGAFAYCYGYARYTNFVGITDQINWDLTERTMKKYVPFFTENDLDPGIPRLFRTEEERKKDPSLYLISED